MVRSTFYSHSLPALYSILQYLSVFLLMRPLLPNCSYSEYRCAEVLIIAMNVSWLHVKICSVHSEPVWFGFLLQKKSETTHTAPGLTLACPHLYHQTLEALLLFTLHDRSVCILSVVR